MYDQVPWSRVPFPESVEVVSAAALIATKAALSPASDTLRADVEWLSRPKACSFEVTSSIMPADVIARENMIRSAHRSTTPSDATTRRRIVRAVPGSFEVGRITFR